MEPSVTYNKAPLVELIVEIRWGVQTAGIAGGPAIVIGQSALFDLWSQQLGHALRSQGYHNLERLIPHGMVLLANQPLFRYSQEGERFPIVQLGHGIFTVNAGPPTYRCWASFRPQVEQAVKALVENKPGGSEPATFSRIALRYIDLFDTNLRGGAANYPFMRDELGVGFSLPDGLIEFAADPNRINPTLALNLPISDENNANLTFQIAAARLGDRSSVDTIMDMTYAIDGDLPLQTDAALESLDKGYAVIHDWFEKLTVKVRDRMEPAS